MKMQYGYVSLKEKEILSMKKAGKSNREIAEHFGFKDKYVVKGWLKRYHRRQGIIVAGIQPFRRGRPPKGSQPVKRENESEIKRLRMENELLRDFLHAAGRR